MRWQKMVPENQLCFSEVDRAKRIWYKSDYLITNVNLLQFGKIWGKKEIGVRISFSIHHCKGKDREHPFQLLISDNQPMNGHIYVDSIAKGKKIAAEIVKQIKKSWRFADNPWKSHE